MLGIVIRQDSQKMDREDLTNRKEIVVQSKLTKSIELVDHLVLWMAMICMICTSINTNINIKGFSLKRGYEAERHGLAPPSKIDQNIELIN